MPSQIHVLGSLTQRKVPAGRAPCRIAFAFGLHKDWSGGSDQLVINPKRQCEGRHDFNKPSAIRDSQPVISDEQPPTTACKLKVIAIIL